MTDPQIAASQNRQAEIEALKSAFFASGGSIQEMPITRRTERPAHYNKLPLNRNGGQNVHEPDDAVVATQIRKLVEEGHSKLSIKATLKISHPRLLRIMQAHKIEVPDRPLTRQKGGQPKLTQEVADEIRRHGQGITRQALAERYGINVRTVSRILNYEIY